MSYARNRRRRLRARGWWFPGIEQAVTVSRLAVLPHLESDGAPTVADLIRAASIRGIRNIRLTQTGAHL